MSWSTHPNPKGVRSSRLSHALAASLASLVLAGGVLGASSVASAASAEPVPPAQPQTGALPDFGTPPSYVGRLVIDWNDGEKPRVCTGTVVKTKDRNVVVTAAHCVYKPWMGDGKPASIVFQPQYDSGEKPFGEWKAEDSFASPEYAEPGYDAEMADYAYDAGYIQFAPNAEGKELADVVGAAKLPKVAPPSNAEDPRASRTYDHVKTWGYPDRGNHVYNHEVPVACGDAAPFYVPKGFKSDGGRTGDIVLPCEMGNGSSGGAWFEMKNGDRYGTIVGFTSRTNGGYESGIPSFSYTTPLHQSFIDAVRAHRG